MSASFPSPLTLHITHYFDASKEDVYESGEKTRKVRSPGERGHNWKAQVTERGRRGREEGEREREEREEREKGGRRERRGRRGREWKQNNLWYTTFYFNFGECSAYSCGFTRRRPT